MSGVGRIACAFLCVFVVGVAARASIADAVLARGDDAARAGRVVAAESYYERAEAIGGDRFETVERFALVALLAPRGTDLAGAVRSADRFLQGDPASESGHFDRGLIEWRQRAYAAAAGDFELADRKGDDSRARAFALAAMRRANGERTR